MAKALRVLAGILSILTPLGLFAFPAIESAMWPHRSVYFDYGFLILGLTSLVMMLAFMWYAWRSEAVPPEKRALWVVVLFLGNVVALPFFWFWYVRNPNSSTRAPDVAV